MSKSKNIKKPVGKVKVTFEFSTEETAEDFLGWLCNSGEQDYFEAMYATGGGVGEYMVKDFDYDYDTLTVKCTEGPIFSEE